MNENDIILNFQVVECELLDQLEENNIVDICIEILVDFCNEKNYGTTFEPNVPLSMLERRSEFEVRASKRGDVRVSPTLESGRLAPPTATLVAAVADMLYNVSALARAPVHAWNERGLYRLLFRCASMPAGNVYEVDVVRGSTRRALAAAANHKSVRVTLAGTRDCLHNLLLSLEPMQEDEMDQDSIGARAQGLLLLAALLPERAASDAVWTDLKDRHLTTFFSFLLQSLETDEKELQKASLYCLTQLCQSMVCKKHLDDSRVQFFDHLKCAAGEATDRFSAGDRDDCQPDYVAEELVRTLIRMYQKISLEDRKFQCNQDDAWARVCSSLSSLVAHSARARAHAVHRALPKVLLAGLNAVRDHLSVLGKPVDTIKNANHNPTLRTLYWLLTVISSLMVGCLAAKESFAEDGIAISLNRLWPWCMTTDQLRMTVATLLFNFTNDCPKAWSAMCSCVGSRTLAGEVCVLAAREAALASRARAPALLLLCARALTHCAAHHQCRALLLKSDIISIMYKSIIRERSRAGSAGEAWARLAGAAATHADGAGALLALRPLLPVAPPPLRARLLPALAHAAHHQRPAFLQAPDLLELLSGTLLTGDTVEMVSAARAVWALAANNHKAKLVLRSAGVAAAVQSALQRLQRSRDPAAERALQLLAYTHAVLQTA